MTSPEVEFGDVQFQRVDSNGTQWICVDLDGWADLPETSATLMNRSLDHGGYFGDAYYAPRVLTLDGAIVATDQSTLQIALHQLRTQHYLALQNEVDLNVGEVDGSKFLRVRVGKPSMAVSYISSLAVRVKIELAAAWPVKRNAQRELTAVAVVPGVGRRYPRGTGSPNGFRTYGAAGSTGDIYAVNSGNAPIRPQFIIRGPATRPQIYAPDQNRRLVFGITLAANDVLAVDVDLHTILLNEVGNRRYVLSTDSAWFDILPGQNNLQYRSDTNTGSMTVLFSDGWW